jgi:hypothetical protein
MALPLAGVDSTAQGRKAPLAHTPHRRTAGDANGVAITVEICFNTNSSVTRLVDHAARSIAGVEGFFSLPTVDFRRGDLARSKGLATAPQKSIAP